MPATRQVESRSIKTNVAGNVTLRSFGTARSARVARLRRARTRNSAQRVETTLIQHAYRAQSKATL